MATAAPAAVSFLHASVRRMDAGICGRGACTRAPGERRIQLLTAMARIAAPTSTHGLLAPGFSLGLWGFYLCRQPWRSVRRSQFGKRSRWASADEKSCEDLLQIPVKRSLAETLALQWELRFFVSSDTGEPATNFVSIKGQQTQVACGLRFSKRWQEELFLALQSFRLLPSGYGDGSLCMRAVGKEELWQVAESLLSQLRTFLRLGMVAYNSVASTTSKASQWLRAGQHLDTSRQRSPQGSPDVVAGNVAIGAFGERWQAAAHIFSKLWSWSLADRVSFNTLIRSCRDQFGGSWSWAWALRLLEQCRVVRSRDVVSYSSALHASACSASKDWRMGIMLLRDLEVELLQPDVVLWSAAVNSQARAASWSTAVFLLERLPARSAQPNIQTFGAAMAPFDTGDCWSWALSLMEDLQEMRLDPNTLIYNAAITACEKGREWQMSLALYSSADRDVKPDLITCNAVLSALAQGNWQLALAFFSELGQERKLDIFSFGAALSACDRACLWEHALSILAELPARKLRANTVTCNTAISTCAKAGRWQVALQLLADTCAGTLDVISFNSALAASARAEEWRPALHLLSELPARRLQATSSSCNSAIMACVGSWRWALGVLGSVPSGPDKVSFDAALRACEAQAGRWKEALQLLSDFRAASHQPEVITFSTGITASQAASQWQEVFQLLTALRREELRPSIVTAAAAVLAATFGQHGLEEGCVQSPASHPPMQSEVRRWLRHLQHRGISGLAGMRSC
ncbi:unnamed protein product [Symbiodinium sp. CCMP2456]|nr:unnamed protein product [Symbiodinium sp. CCMP2456]